jgi:hypothetical protein
MFEAVYPDSDAKHALTGVSTYTVAPGQGLSSTPSCRIRATWSLSITACAIWCWAPRGSCE